ncbi:hypothetical protein H113_00685 [Trichophyton rubrum MR1459]|uniref:Uncharacterized protein n=1 Tax=Trichophyton rubrum (strain ATCC MYA-4607 / CBS 118892) TaxID=559305 RepID=A0A080WPN1_TRIRC|nr:uncharacterized protein TERG_12595 [Trichophyton rubrum CBS 118892]EZF99693.1 hypothetical protein H113_00685 [Trichophyton rubrum MR1459]EZG05754.1 hypothetical protein H106_04768 [Trichophyton rubrum CBS 735.88]KFL62837.1 hypothetical protein TERG_12595 [Trichophyton rubrum CBS 118892]
MFASTWVDSVIIELEELNFPIFCSLTIPAYTPSRATRSMCVPCSMTLPFCITIMLSASLAVASRCAIETVVTFSDTLFNAACINLSLVESRAAVASSNSNTGGSRIRARASAMRCFWPPLSSAPELPTLVAKPSGNALMKSIAFDKVAAWRVRLTISRTTSPCSVTASSSLAP